MTQLRLVNNRKSRLFLRRHNAERALEPGANIIEEADLDAFRANPACEGFFAEGWLLVEGVVPEGTQDSLPKYGGDLAKLKPKAAKNAIAGCNDVRQLAIWQAQDARPEIRDALIARYRELNDGKSEEKLDVD